MVLMPIVSRVREDDVRPELPGQILKRLLYLGELRWEVPIAERMHADPFGGDTQKLSRASLRFVLALSRGAPNYPAKFGSRPARRHG
jgi:hypothetical protein